MGTKQKTPNPTWLLGLIFFIIGLCQVVAAVILVGVGTNKIKHAEEITGMVTRITDSNIYVSYRYMGRDYEDDLSFYSSLFEEGERVRLYVNPEKPEDAFSPAGTDVVGFVFGSMGIGFAAAGGAVLYTRYRMRIRTSKLKETGRKIYAEVTGGKVCYKYRVNGRHPYILECKWGETFSDKEYLFRSDYMWENPENYVGQTIAVYLDTKNKGKYFVDLESLQPPEPEMGTLY